MKIYVETPRLILRDWTEEDLPAFARLNADPKVMEFFPSALTEDETLGLYRRIRDELRDCGFGLYAVERREDGAFMGWTGFHRFSFDADFAPGIEIGWRLAHEYWGHGYAPEAAAACLNDARRLLGGATDTKEVFSFTAVLNKRSERVMQKIGMEYVKDFGHPLVASAHPLHPHRLYRATI